jgi:hypothetical protein
LKESNRQDIMVKGKQDDKEWSWYRQVHYQRLGCFELHSVAFTENHSSYRLWIDNILAYREVSHKKSSRSSVSDIFPFACWQNAPGLLGP